MSRSSFLAIVFVCVCAGGSALGDDENPVRFELGVVEEHFEPRPDVPSRYSLGFRPLFFWDTGRWHIFQVKGDVAPSGPGGGDVLEVIPGERWYLPGAYASVVIDPSEASYRASRTQNVFVRIVDGTATLPRSERSRDFSGWYMDPVQRPFVVSTSAEVIADYTVPVATVPKESPEPVARALREEFHRLYRTREWAVAGEESDALSPQAEAELQSLLKKATLFSFEGESVRIYAFSHDDDIPWLPCVDPPLLIGEDQISGEVWVIGEGLRYLCRADFNLNGTAEHIFWIDRFRENGYLLAGEAFRQLTSLSWRYD